MKCQTAGCDYDLCATCCASDEKRAAHADGKHAFAAYETLRWLYHSHVAKWFVSGVRADMEKRLQKRLLEYHEITREGADPIRKKGHVPDVRLEENRAHGHNVTMISGEERRLLVAWYESAVSGAAQ